MGKLAADTAATTEDLILLTAEEFPERLKKFVRKSGRFSSEIIQPARKHLVAAVNFTGGSRNLVDRKIDIVRGLRRLTSGGSEMIGK